MNNPELSIFNKYESEARSYCRVFPIVLDKAKGSVVFDDHGNKYIDFICGAGALNYGHNNGECKQAVLDYINSDGISMSLDFHSQSKKSFISTFQENILEPRGLDYKMQFTSPSGTSVVESAVKLARKYTGRQNIVAFTNAFHGMTGASLSLTGSQHHRQLVSYGSVTRLPYDGYLGEHVDSIAFYRKLFVDSSSGVDLPAAIILETIQGEGGLTVSSVEWLQDLRELTKEFGILLIVDDVQAGCGRSGKFFSFERAKIKPDIVCLSKSIGGMGLPLAVLLFSPELDIWSAGEDNGTFRGNNLAFVASSAILRKYWKGFEFEKELHEKETIIRQYCESIQKRFSLYIRCSLGIGLMRGLEFISEADARAVIESCFKNHLLLESCGSRDQVLKFMPALNIDIDTLREGLSIVEKAIHQHYSNFTDVLPQRESLTELC